jgi:SAM-dependent methyltransferase
MEAVRLLAEFERRDRSRDKVAAAIADTAAMTHQAALDGRKYPGMYAPTLAAVLEAGAGATGPGLRFLHLGANHGVFCRFLQGLPGIRLCAALDLSHAALRLGRTWQLRDAVVADAVSLAAFRAESFDLLLAESLYVPNYWRPAQIARGLEAAARVLRPGGLLLVQEWGFDFSHRFAAALTAAAFREHRRITTPAETQQGPRNVTCFVYGKTS